MNEGEDRFDALEMIIGAHLPEPEGRTPDAAANIFSAYTKTDAAVHILSAYSLGGAMFGRSYTKTDAAALDALEAALNAAETALEALSADTRVTLLEAASAQPTGDTAYWSLRHASAALRAALPAARARFEGPPQGKAEWRAAAVAEACREVWRWRTGNEAPRVVSRQHPPMRGAFELFAREVFNALGMTSRPTVSRALELAMKHRLTI